MVEGLRGLGASIEATDDGFVVQGTGGLRGGTIASHGDHRLAMLGAVAGLASRDGVEVGGHGRGGRQLPPRSRPTSVAGEVDPSRSRYLSVAERAGSRPEPASRPERPPQSDPKGWRVEPAPDGRGAPPAPKPPMFPRNRKWIALIVGLLALNFVAAFITGGPEKRPQVPYSPFFLDQVKAGNVQEISSRGETIQGDLKKAATFTPPGGKAKSVDLFKTEVPAFVDTTDLTKQLESSGVVVNAEPADSGRSFLATLLLGFGPTILLVGLFIWLMRRQMSGGAGGVLGGFGRSTARRVAPGDADRVTFDDVAGIDEAEDELVEIVDFLKNPEQYMSLGARIPRGVLLYGPPGTGKTLLARAVAGEAEAAFFSLSASEFVEAIVGVGASRVRDLFKQAKEAAPAIVFIDELDAIGRSRSGNVGGLSGGNDEREQTLNQILTEMDGFEPTDNVIVLGATNRPEVLDPALLRPGRFDRRIAVQPPDRPGRVRSSQIHTRSVPLDADVDLEQIAASTPGMTGADLALLVNEAALFAARRGHAARRAAATSPTRSRRSSSAPSARSS